MLWRYGLNSTAEAYVDLIEDWAGLLVSDGYGVYQKGVNARQTGLAHLIRTARGSAVRPHPELAACGDSWTELLNIREE